MKRLLYFLGILFLTVSCSIHEVDMAQETNTDSMTFYASFESVYDSKTKAYADEELSIRWNASDQISIFNRTTYNQPYQFEGQDGDNAGAFRKIESDSFVTGNPIAEIVSVYPFQESTRISEKQVVSVVLPAIQKYATKSFGLGANTMISVASDSLLQFKNIGGYLSFSLYGEDVSVSSITLRGNGGEKIAGLASVTLDQEGIPNVNMSSSAGEEIVLTCNSPIKLGKTPEESTEFWFVIPPTVFTKGFTVTVHGDGGVFIQVTEKKQSVERNRLGRMEPIKVALKGIDGYASLSAYETANCYMVYEAGNYCFNASVIGNGYKGMIPGCLFHSESVYIRPQRAAVLWQEPNIVSNVVIKDGFICFTVNSVKGNALIAVYDDQDQIQWSWHIWATDKPEDVQITPGTHTYMDRNLGATSSSPGQSSSIGLYYQWGRKDPLHPSFAKQVDMPDPLMIEYLIQHPMELVQSNSYRWVQDQSGEQNVGLWGNPDGELSVAMYKTIYDPCPEGYTIPPDDAWYELGRVPFPGHRYASLYDPTIIIEPADGGNVIFKETKSLYYPIVRPLFNDSSSTVGYYLRNSHTSCAGFDSGYVSPNYANVPEAATQVRCVREEVFTPYPPTVESKQAEDVKVHDLVLVGSVINNGNSPVLKTGFIWGLSPSEMNSEVVVPFHQKDFKARINDLPTNAVVYYRAFAENKAGISYGTTIKTPLISATEYAKHQLDTLSRRMTVQYCNTQGMNGEGTIRLWYGDLPGNSISTNQTGWAPLYNSQILSNTSSSYSRYPLIYYYGLINRVNNVLDNFLAHAEETNSNKAKYEAELLGYRAYAYMMLVQLYCKSWDDSENGSSNGVPLRIHASEDVTTIPKLSEVYQQIYSDLDQAISLMKMSEGIRNDVNEIDLQTLYAIYAKAALNRKDYAIAANYAKLARSGHELMSNAEYRSGFNSSNGEWIWGAHPDNLSEAGIQLYYYSYFSYIASNGNSSICRNYPKSISRELFDRLPNSDLRKSFFLNPEGYTYDNTSGKAHYALQSYAYLTYPSFLYTNSTIFAYMQFKFRNLFQPGGGQMNFIRSAEMVLVEAEADYFLGREAEVQSLLIYLNRTSGRDPQYSCNKSGSALLDELKFYRRIELWGEGFDWFDVKRWNDPISRKSFNEGGNFMSAFAGTWTAKDRNDFVWVMPDNYETLIRTTSLRPE